MSRLRRRTAGFTYVARMTALAFLLNVLLPFFAVYNVSRAEAAEPYPPSALSAMFGEKLLICTADGFKWVNAADLQNGKETPTPHPEFKCAACYVAAHGIKTPPAVGVAIPQHLAAIHVFIPHFSPPTAIRSTLFLHGRHSRAPPASMIG